jgi:hypothetical protein
MSSIFEATYLPRRPLASDEKSGGYRRYAREQALTKHYIESNPKSLRNLIVVDSDFSDTLANVGLSDLPQPLYAVTNLYTGTGHIVYALKDPVCLTDAGRRAPVNLLARVEQGLNLHFQGDPAYLNGITKNPLAPPLANITTEFNSRGYTLAELAAPLAELGLLEPATARKRLFLSSVGRNVSLFESTRLWAYKAIRGSFDDIASGGWDKRVLQFAWEINETEISAEFAAGALSFNEVKGLAQSVSRWTARKFSAGAFQKRQQYLSDRAAEERTRGTQMRNGGVIEWAQ